MALKPQPDDLETNAVRPSAKSRREALREAARGREHFSPPTLIAEEASVFISYSRRDQAAVEGLVEWLRLLGVTVVWDRDFLSGTIDHLIKRAIDDAHCVIVIWSDHACHSDWVCGEARRALVAAKLVATHIDGFSIDDLSLEFSGQNSVPISDLERIAGSLAKHGVAVRR